jgi:phosphoribosylanthranilate isomerase
MHVRIKICGITNERDAQLAVELGADAIGLNFYAKSLRCIDQRKALAISRDVPLFVEVVPVFVNVTQEEAKNVFPARLMQIHTDRPEVIPGRDAIGWIVAFPVKDASSLKAIQAYLRLLRSNGDFFPAAILVDASVPGQYGGTGQTAPWHLLADFKPGVPLILAGGLTPDNVAEAIRIVRPYAVDVASGVESSPGQKDAGKMRRFIDAVRDACRD